MRYSKTRIAIALFIVITSVFAGLFCYLLYTPFTSDGEKHFLYIDSDDSIDSVYVAFEKVAATPKIFAFKVLNAALKYEQNVRTGKYEMGNGTTTLQLIRNLRNGNQEPVRLVVPSVRTLERLSAKFSRALEADSAEWMKAFSDSTLIGQFGYTQTTLPCLFIPNTYEVYWDITPLQLLKKMEKENKRYWNESRLEKAGRLGLSTHEVITLASIVDQETANNAEKPSIAGMYLNRLHKGMLLQADPTVKFALRKFGLRRILHEHLKFDSPYNTYIYKGLPPGPISIPAVSSIEAVLNAENNSYLYMCAKEDFSGTHNFATTYAQHLANARKYTRALDKRGIK